MTRLLHSLLGDDDGATAVEYGLIAALVVIAMVGALATMSTSTNNMWNDVEGNVTSATAQ